VTHLDSLLDVPGGRLHFVIDGEDEATPLALVHSAVVDLRSWDRMIPFLVDAGYRVIRHDMRGFGQSTTEDVAHSPSADLRAVLDAVGVGQVAVAGNSLGAAVALDAILETPGRFVAYAWIGGGIGGFRPTLEEPVEEQALDAEWEVAVKAGDIDAMSDIDRRAWLDGIGQPPARVPADVREWFLKMNRPLNDPKRPFGQPAPLEPPANDRLADLAIPALVVIGELDTARTRAAAVRLATTAPGARLVSWPDVAHMIGMEQPERLAATLIDFLAPLPRWR
jgi:pimeloyl-ACP methyl ester carboxylesterase